MIVSLYNKQIQENGYIVFRTAFEEITFATKKESGYFNAIRIINCKKEFSFTHEQYEEQKKDIISNIRRTGENDVHLMTLIFFEDIQKAMEIAGDDYMCWLVDKVSNNLLLNDARIEDFYGLRDDLTGFLEKCRTFFANGDIKALDSLSHDSYEKKKIEKIKKKKPIPITLLLISINITVFGTYLIIGNAFVDSGCMDPVKIAAGEYYRLITAMFLHAGLDHIFSNLILLFFLGEVVESKIGSVRFAILYLLSGITGNMVSYFYSSYRAGYTSIGASGAVFGLIGMFIIMAIKKYDGIEVPKNRLILMIVYSIYSSFDAYVDFAAHFGGLVAGLIIGLLFLTLGGKKSEG